jgi:hypothetical protein
MRANLDSQRDRIRFRCAQLLPNRQIADARSERANHKDSDDRHDPEGRYHERSRMFAGVHVGVAATVNDAGAQPDRSR